MKTRGVAGVLSIVLLVALLTFTLLTPPLGTTALYELVYSIYYDLHENTGLMVIRFSVDTGGDIAVFTIPVSIFEQGIIECLNYTATPRVYVLGLDFNNETGVLQLLISGLGVIEVLFSVENISSEFVAEHSVVIDTTALSEVAQNVTVELYVAGVYDVYVSSFYGVATIGKLVEANITKIVISGFAWLELVFRPELETQELMGEQPKEGAMPIRLDYLLVGLIVLSATSGIALYIYHRFKSRGVGVVVEHVDYHRDSALRLIISALGESGEHGLTQSEISRKTGLPKSTVSRKLHRLIEEGVVEVKRAGKYNYVVLTPKGLNIYKKISERGAEKK